MSQPGLKKIYIAVAVLISSCSFAGAQETALSNFYLSGFGSLDFAGGEVEPFGNNIAVDPDFTTPFKGGFNAGWGIGVGKRLNSNLRMEARYGNRTAQVNDTTIGTGARNGFDYNVDFESQVQTAMFDLFYDIRPSAKVSPYLKGGLGASFTDTSATIDSSTDPLFTDVLGPAGFLNDEGRYPYASTEQSSFSWNVGAGVNVRLSQRLSMFTEYQYLGVGDIATQADAFTDGFKADDFGLHEIIIGLTLGF